MADAKLNLFARSTKRLTTHKMADDPLMKSKRICLEVNSNPQLIKI